MSSVSLLISSKIFLATREFPGSIEKRCGKATWSSLKATHFSQETAVVLTKKVPKFDRKRPLLLGNWSCFSATPIFGLFRPFLAYRKTTLDPSVRPRPEIRPPKFAPQPTPLHTHPHTTAVPLPHRNAPNRPQAGHRPVANTFPFDRTHSPILDRSHQRRTLATTAVHHCQKQSQTNPAIVVDHLLYQTVPCIIPSHQPTAPNQEPSP